MPVAVQVLVPRHCLKFSPRAAHMVFDSCSTAGSPRGWAGGTNPTAPHIMSMSGPSQRRAVPLTAIDKRDPVPDHGESVRLTLGVGSREHVGKGPVGGQAGRMQAQTMGGQTSL